MEVNSDYPLARLGKARVTVTVRGGKMIVSQDATYHPSASIKGHKADCYFYEVLLLIWVKDEASALPMAQKSAWISLDDEVPFFEYKFDHPENAVEWLVCVRQVLGMTKSGSKLLLLKACRFFWLVLPIKKTWHCINKGKKRRRRCRRSQGRRKRNMMRFVCNLQKGRVLSHRPFRDLHTYAQRLRMAGFVTGE